MDHRQLDNIERWNLVFAALLILVGALFFETPVALGLTVGALLSCANFYGVHKLIQRATLAAGGRKTALYGLFMAKLVGLMIAVALCILYLPMSPLAFVIGISVFLVSIAVESVRTALGSAPSNGEENGRA